jgi:GNAT superfamily N-acetyltransferase
MAELELNTNIREEDYEPLFLIDYKCFYNFPEIARALFPGGLDPAQSEANVESMKIGVFGGPDRAYAKITANNGSEIAAFISCRIYRGPRGLLDDTSDPTKTTLPRVEDSEDRAFYEWYWNTVREKLRDMKEFQVPHISIQAIATDPKWQRQGAGAMMMNWYIDLARKEGIGRCALYAGPFAAEIGFYEKFGFQRGAAMTFTNEDRFPGRVGTPEVVMWRDV